MFTRPLTTQLNLHVSTIPGVDSASMLSNGTGTVRLPFGSDVYALLGGAPTTTGQSYDRGAHRYR